MHTKTIIPLLISLTVGAALGAGGMYALGDRRVEQPAHTRSDVPASTAPVQEPPSPAPPPSIPEPRQTSDADRALSGVQRGEILLLDDILAKVRLRFPGEVLGVKLSEDDGVPEYELKVQVSGGRILEIDVDPRTGNILDVDEDDD